MASWMTLATAKAWIGVAIGGAMIFGATRLRRWRDEG
jgi:ABC-2 type transport system permease protein